MKIMKNLKQKSIRNDKNKKKRYKICKYYSWNIKTLRFINGMNLYLKKIYNNLLKKITKTFFLFKIFVIKIKKIIKFNGKNFQISISIKNHSKIQFYKKYL